MKLSAAGELLLGVQEQMKRIGAAVANKQLINFFMVRVSTMTLLTYEMLPKLEVFSNHSQAVNVHSLSPPLAHL
jgi:hypothetical protein